MGKSLRMCPSDVVAISKSFGGADGRVEQTALNRRAEGQLRQAPDFQGEFLRLGFTSSKLLHFDLWGFYAF